MSLSAGCLRALASSALKSCFSCSSVIIPASERATSVLCSWRLKRTPCCAFRPAIWRPGWNKAYFFLFHSFFSHLISAKASAERSGEAHGRRVYGWKRHLSKCRGSNRAQCKSISHKHTLSPNIVFFCHKETHKPHTLSRWWSRTNTPHISGTGEPHERRRWCRKDERKVRIRAAVKRTHQCSPPPPPLRPLLVFPPPSSFFFL